MKNYERYMLVVTAITSLIFYSLNLFISQDFALDSYLYTDLIKLSNPWEYFTKLFQGQMYDFQPIRDLFLLIDVWGERVLGFSFRILSNTVMLGILLYFSVKLFEKWNLSRHSLICLFALNPVLLHIVGIDTAKKHILSAIFIVMFLNQIYSVKRNDKLSVLFLILSILSQPINILLGLIPVAKSYFESRSVKDNIKFAVITIFFAGLNWLYYRYSFTELVGVSKYYSLPVEDKVFSLGRFFFQIALPIELIYFYFKGAILNFVGIIAFVLIGYAIYKSKLTLPKELYVFMFLSGFIIVNTQSTQIFHQDTYVLTALIGFLFLMSDILSKFSIKKRRVFVFIISIFYVYNSIQLLISKQSYGVFIERSVASNPSCRNVYNATKFYFTRQNISKMLDYGEDMISRKCFFHTKDDIALNSLMNAEILYYTKELSLVEKINIFSTKKNQSELDIFILLALSVEQENVNEFQKYLKIYNDHFSGEQLIQRPWSQKIKIFCEQHELARCDKF